MKINASITGFRKATDIRIEEGDAIESDSFYIWVQLDPSSDAHMLPVDGKLFFKLLSNLSNGSYDESTTPTVQQGMNSPSLDKHIQEVSNELNSGYAPPARPVFAGKDENGYPIMVNPDGTRIGSAGYTNGDDSNNDEDGVGQI